MSARCANQSGSKSLFVDYAEDFFFLSEIFSDTFLYHLREKSTFTSHIDEVDFFSGIVMGKEFIVHGRREL
jgi:hypothetical protein